MYPHLHFFGRTFTTYGFMTGLSYLIAALWLWRMRPEMKAPEDTVADFWALIYALFFGAALGGRLGFYVVEWRSFSANPLAMLRQWRNGWVFWGGALGIMAAGGIFQQVWNRSHRPRAFLPLADYFALVAPLCHAIGRLGCLLGGCCFGRPTTVPWAIRFTNPYSNISRDFLGIPLHPTQLYEAAGDVLIFLFLSQFVMPRVRRREYTAGTTFLAWVLLYSTLRFTIEFFRGDPRGELLSPILSPSQWISLAAFLGASTLLARQGILERHPEQRSPYLA